MAGYRGLAKRSASIRLGGGIDQANDPFVVDSPSVLEAENVRFEDRGAIAKRYGSASSSTSGKPSSATTGAPNSLHLHRGTLVEWWPAGAYIYDESATDVARSNQCSPRPSRVLTDPIIRTNDNVLRPDIAVIGTLACIVYEDEVAGLCRYVFVDFSSGRLAIVANKTFSNVLAHKPRVIASSTGTRFNVVGSSSGGDAYVASYLVSADTYTFSSGTSLGANVGTGDAAVWDIATDGGAYFTLMYWTAGISTIFRQCNHAGATGTTKTVATFLGYALMYNPVLATIVAVGRSGATWAYITRFASDYSGSATTSSLFTPTTGLDLPTASSDIDPARVTLCQKTDSGEMLAAFSHYGQQIDPVQAGTDVVNIGVAYSPTNTGKVRGVAIAAKAQYLGSMGVYDAVLPLCEQIGVGMTVSGTEVFKPAPYGVLCRFLTNAAGDYGPAVCGKFLVDKIDKTADLNHLSNTVATSGGELFFAATIATTVPIIGAPQLTKREADLVRVKLLDAPAVRSVTAQNLLVMAGGAGPCVVDGQQCSELTPPCVTTVVQSGTDPSVDIDGGALPDAGDATRLYPLKLVHRWIDAQGNIHRGAPSDVFTLAWTGLTSSDPAPMIRFSSAEPTALNGDRLSLIQVEVYQAAQPDASDFRFIGVATPLTVASSPMVQYIIGVNDTPTVAHAVRILGGADLAPYPALYTQSEAEAVPAPPLLDVCSTQSRLWGLSAERRLEVIPTKPIVAGIAPEFYSTTISVPAQGGEGVGLAALDDKVVVFKERNVYVLFGSPGDANGEGSTLQTARLVSGDVGCVNANSIVEGPFGVAFLSERGFYTIDRGLQFAFIGEPVKRVLDGATLTSGVLAPATSEVRWTFGTSEALVWNYRINAWSYWSGVDAVHACMWREYYTRIDEDGALHVEVADYWDTGTSDGMQVTTAWLKFAGLQGYQRIWRSMLLGRHYSGGLRVYVGYDYDVDFTDEFFWTETELEALRGGSDRIQLQINPSRQKCEAIRFRIEEVTEYVDESDQAFEWFGQGLELVGMDLEIGMRRGTFKGTALGAKR